jgi:hypothetical protein
MMKRKNLIGAVAALVASPLVAGTWYADASRPSDEGDGLTPATAKRYIQSAIDLAEAAADDAARVVKVAPGTYAEGVQEDATAGRSRVVISKPLTLESTGGRDVTFIDGQADANGASGLGASAVRGVFVRDTAAGSVVRGFTFRSGATASATSFATNACGGAVAFGGTVDAPVYVKDCSAIDCAASFGGAFANVVAIRSLARRCHNSGSSGGGAALYKCRAYACVFDSCGASDSYNENILVGDGPYANCTAVGNSGSLLRTSSSQRMYNTISCYATRQEFDSSNNGGDYVIKGYSQGSTGFTQFCDVTDETEKRNLLFSPLTGDYRIVKGGKADGFGDPQYCKLEWIPEADRGLDYNGTSFDVSGAAGTIHCGAVQTAVAATGGMIVSSRVVPTKDTSSLTLGLYARAATWPEQLWVPVADDVFAVTNAEATAPARFPSAGGFWQTIPASGTLTLKPVSATAQLAVGSDAAYTNIQAAVDAASDAADAFTVVTVAAGEYGPVSVGGKNVFIRSSGGKSVTTIRGAKDASATDANAGCGPAAKRCVTVASGERLVAVEGFTLADGATGVYDGSTGTAENAESWGDAAKAGGFFVAANKTTDVQLLDCDVVDCAGANAAAVWGGWLQRCVIRGSAQPQYGNSVVRQAILSSCYLYENDFRSNQIFANGCEVNNCTVSARCRDAWKSVASSSSSLQGVVVCGGKFEQATPTVGSVFDQNLYTINVTNGFTTAAAYVANPDGGLGRLLAGSAAIGAWDASQKAATTLREPWTVLVDDLEGKSVEVVDGKVTAGAFQTRYEPKDVYVDAARTDDGGDGLTAATAKWTLAGALAVAGCGDTVHLAAGTYAEGAMSQLVSFTGDKNFDVKARVRAWEKLTLAGAGADKTTIRGGYAADGEGELVRGVVLLAGATLRDVTVEGGLCETNANVKVAADDACGAGVLGDATSVVEDCVLRGNYSSREGAVHGGVFRRCVFTNNWAMGNAFSVGSLRVAENCLFTGNRGASMLADYERLDGCTFLNDNANLVGNRISTFGEAAENAVIRNSALILAPTAEGTPLPTLVNCLLPKITGQTWKWAATNGVNATDCLLNGDCEVNATWAATWDGKPTTDFAGVDRGANAAAPEGTDLAGVQRVQNGVIDIGCYELDRMADCTKAFVKRDRATVTATAGDVHLTDGRLVLASGGSLTATVNETAEEAWSVSATVSDGGKLVAKVNGVVTGSWNAAKGILELGRLAQGDVIEIVAEGGSATSPFLQLARGLCVIIR